jgi:hypothetical protein
MDRSGCFRRLKMKRSRIIFYCGIFFGLTLLIQNCYYDNVEELYPGPCDISVITYEAKVFPIIDNNCLGCHSSSSAEGGVVLESYTNLSPYIEDGSFACSINWESGCSPMPQNSAF